MTNEERQEFVRAVRADNYAEWSLSDNVTVITDWQGDGRFEPYIVTETGETSVQEVEDTLDEQDVFTVENVTEDPQNEKFFELEGIDFNYWAEDVVKE